MVSVPRTEGLSQQQTWKMGLAEATGLLPFAFLAGKMARLHFPISLAGKIESCDLVLANRLWVM